MNRAGGETQLLLDRLLLGAHGFQPLWLKAAFIFLLVGYGTKMGLAPLHTWLPDAHSESPSIVSALLSGALLNCAFLGILRAQQILAAAGLAAFGQELLIGFGLLSMGFAAVFILGRPTTNGCSPTPAWSTWGSWRWGSAWAARPRSARCSMP